MYKVKTRNFNCKTWVLYLLNLIAKNYRVDTYNDGDGKFYLETKNRLKAWTMFLYFMALRPFSGGWTYICRPGADVDCNCKTIY